MSSILARSTNVSSGLADEQGVLTGPREPVRWIDHARFWSKALVPSGPHGDRECWPWQASTAKGYGQFKVRGELRRAHQVAYEIARGPVPDGMQVLHSCDNPLCVNPKHLSAGTHQDNMIEKRDRGRVWYGGPRRKGL